MMALLGSGDFIISGQTACCSVIIGIGQIFFLALNHFFGRTGFGSIGPVGVPAKQENEYV